MSEPTDPREDGTVEEFLKLLDTPPFALEQPISEAEAQEAITLFAVANLMLGGSSQRQVGNETKTDVLGVLTLYYGLQDKSLPASLVVQSQQVWRDVGARLKALRDDLDGLGADAEFLVREARRQFNLGRSSAAVGNTAFPSLFNRYVAIATDPLLSLDLRIEQSSEFSDKEQLGRAFDLLRDLKDVVLQIVRSLSKYGTIATERANQDWAGYEGEALRVLQAVADARVSEDQDERTPWAILAELTGKDREREVAPYIVLGREGRRLLTLALEAYRLALKNQRLDSVDRQDLLDLFQAEGDPAQFLTTRMRNAAALVRRYPLAGWG